MSTFDVPSGYDRIRLVGSFRELADARFERGVNAICWPRVLPGNFQEVAEKLSGHYPQADCDEPDARGIGPLDEAVLAGLELGEAGSEAVRVLLEDQRLLREQGLEAQLDLIRQYPQDESGGAVRTDVYSFHADSAPAEAQTWLCTYFGASSEGLRNDQAQLRAESPATRQALLAEFGGVEGAEFGEFLQENCYDLHYAALAGAKPFVFGLGNLWKIAVDFPGSPVPPCIHCAPETSPSDPPRLLLIS